MARRILVVDDSEGFRRAVAGLLAARGFELLASVPDGEAALAAVTGACPDGAPLHAGTGQPLFHVEHSVGGAEQRPLNRWRIVHLTGTADDRLTAVFERMAADPWLPEHTEIYIRDNLGVELARN